MKKNYTFLAAICLATAFTVGCSKSDDSTSSTQTQTQTGGGQQQQNTVTTDFLQGTWKIEEVEKEGIKYSTSTEVAIQREWNAFKSTAFVFTNNELRTIEKYYDEPTRTHVNRTTKYSYTLDQGKMKLSGTDNSVTERVVTREGDKFVMKITAEGKTTKLTLVKGTPNEAVQKQAVAKITITGTPVAGSKVLLYDQDPRPGGIANKEIKEITNGKADFDVKEYIGKKLYFVVMDPRTNRFLSELVEKNIVEGDNEIAITVAIQTGAKITVTKNGTALQNEEVYFVGESSTLIYEVWKMLVDRTSYNKNQAKEALKTLTKVQTNAQGVAEVSLSAGTYKVVLLEDNSFKETEVVVTDGQVKEVTIDLSPVAQKVDVTFSVTDKDNRLWDDVEITLLGQTKRTSDGRATFQLDANRNYSYTTKTLCGEIKTGRFTTTDTRTVFVDYEVSSKGTIIVQNRSNGNNPYTVKVNGIERTVQGGADLEVRVPLNQEIQVSWKQISGYVFSPTTGERNVTTSCSEKVATVTFR